MNRIILHNVPPYTGSYELVLSDDFTTREWGWSKRLADYLPGDFGEDQKPLGDPEFLCVLAVVALHRAGKVETREVPDVFEKLLDSPVFDMLTIETDPVPEAEKLPPTSETKSNGNTDTSGPGSTASLAHWELSPRPTGDPLSATSDSGPQTSGT